MLLLLTSRKAIARRLDRDLNPRAARASAETHLRYSHHNDGISPWSQLLNLRAG